VDKPRVEKLAHALEARGLDIWWDHELIAGERYSELIAQHLDSAKAVIVVWSAASIGSEWVCDEANVGKDRGVLVPVMFERVKPPLGYRQFQSENLAGWPDEPAGQAAFERLVQALERLKGRPTPAGVSAATRPAPKPQGLVSGLFGGAKKGPVPWAIAAVGLGGATLLAFSLPRPAMEPAQPAEEPPGEAVLLGPEERYGLSDAEIAGLEPVALARRALDQSSFDVIEAAAAERDTLSLALLCIARSYGVGTEANVESAQLTCADAAARGAPIGGYVQSVLARPTDPARADALLETAVIAGDPRAQHDRAEALIASGQSLPRARSLAETCAARGNVECKFLFATLQADGVGGARDPAAARTALQKLVDPPYFHAGAARELGLLLVSGADAGPPDPAAGIPLLLRAQVLGDGQASFELGKLAEAGIGMPQSIDEALKHFDQAVADGYPPAQAEADRLRGM
jgi:TPR repeat protein